jgi:hypothetical protein
LCEFIDRLVIREFESLVERGSIYRQFEPIRINSNLWLNIQASKSHYCNPRKTIKDLEEYTHWEIALFNKDEDLLATEVLHNFRSLAELELYFEGSVYAYVPKDLVEEFYLALK